MRTLGPVPVDPRSWWVWLREALALTRRRWPTALGWAALFLVASPVLNRLPVPLELVAESLLAITFLTLFILLAEAADRTHPPWMVIKQRLRHSYRQLLWAAMAVITLYVLLAVVMSVMFFLSLSAWFSGEPASQAAFLDRPPPPSPNELPAFVLGSPLLGYVAALLPLGIVGNWFVLPLIASLRCSLRQAVMLSLEAMVLNLFVMKVSAVWLLLTLVLPGPCAAAVGPILGAMLYVSYRHVFLGPKENAPEQKAVQQTILAG